MAIQVDFASVKGEDLLQPPSLERTRPPRTAEFLVTLPCKVANGTGSRFKYANALPQVLFPYIAISSASPDLGRRASEPCPVAWDAPAHSFRAQEQAQSEECVCLLTPSRKLWQLL